MIQTEGYKPLNNGHFKSEKYSPIYQSLWSVFSFYTSSLCNDFSEVIKETLEANNREVFSNLIKIGYVPKLDSKLLIYLATHKKFVSIELLFAQSVGKVFEKSNEKAIQASITEIENQSIAKKTLRIYLKYFPPIQKSNSEIFTGELLKSSISHKKEKLVKVILKSEIRFCFIKKIISGLPIFKELTLENLQFLESAGFEKLQLKKILENEILFDYARKAKTEEEIQVLRYFLEGESNKELLNSLLIEAINFENVKVVDLLLKKVNPHENEVSWKFFYDSNGNCVHNIYLMCSPFQRALMLEKVQILEVFKKYIGESYQTLIDSYVKANSERLPYRDLKNEAH